MKLDSLVWRVCHSNTRWSDAVWLMQVIQIQSMLCIIFVSFINAEGRTLAIIEQETQLAALISRPPSEPAPVLSLGWAENRKSVLIRF